jgi:hypothetical protein
MSSLRVGLSYHAVATDVWPVYCLATPPFIVPVTLPAYCDITLLHENLNRFQVTSHHQHRKPADMRFQDRRMALRHTWQPLNFHRSPTAQTRKIRWFCSHEHARRYHSMSVLSARFKFTCTCWEIAWVTYKEEARGLPEI